MNLITLDIECKQAVELMSDYLDSDLPTRLRKKLERHLKKCDHCAAYLEQLRVTIEVTGNAQPEDLDPDTLSGLIEIFRQVRPQEKQE